MARTFTFERFDIYTPWSADAWKVIPSSEGECVLAQDALDREAVNAAKIRTLETQLAEARRELEILRKSYYD